ncbi:Oidioi.mRNA.OKI2018_I69.XSR.g13271.t1.cds [Oikopleura dioica]|uniref:Outer mitochondrial transmembrane helix translocase n=1 Tax=Oikopleura dioica TaxID=34765 RepID=A0ABN7S6E7_OIKDI|nr:Oidioi.mRNA.OKI2018_I69.XSR.g13271.t1.cds [Oikopleura dioica]
MLKAIREGWDKLWERLLQDNGKLLHVVGDLIVRLIAAYLAYESTMLTMKFMQSQLMDADKTRAAEILEKMGYSEKFAADFLRSAPRHEWAVIEHFVTDSDELNDMAAVKGLKKEKETINRNLKFALNVAANPDFAKLVKVTQGLLIPPGCGKTMLARAIAREAGFNFLVVQPSLVNSKWIGESEKFIQAFFSVAKKLAPTVIFVDEIDVFLGNRNDESFHEHTQIKIAEFLTAWDGFDQNKGAPVVVIGATNRKDTLDEAILRRLPIKVEIPLPNSETIRQIIESKLPKEDFDVKFDFVQLIEKMNNWDCSKVHNFVQFAVTSAVHEFVEERSQKLKLGESLSDYVHTALQKEIKQIIISGQTSEEATKGEETSSPSKVNSRSSEVKVKKETSASLVMQFLNGVRRLLPARKTSSSETEAEAPEEPKKASLRVPILQKHFEEALENYQPQSDRAAFFNLYS